MRQSRKPLPPITSPDYIAAMRALRRSEARLTLAAGLKSERDARCRVLFDQEWVGDAATGVLAQEMPRSKTAALNRSRYISQLEDAIIWMSGSADFAPGGKARTGWLKVSRLLQAHHRS